MEGFIKVMPLYHNLLNKYKNKVFVETGSWQGEGIKIALECGFERIFSIEISPQHVKVCRMMFKNESRVELIEGNSAVCLQTVLEKLKEPVTFWLDAHNAGYFAGIKNMEECAALGELDAIAKHEIKTHTIMLDDVRLMREPAFGVSIEEVVKKLQGINPKYRILYEDSPAAAQDIMVAVK